LPYNYAVYYMYVPLFLYSKITDITTRH